MLKDIPNKKFNYPQEDVSLNYKMTNTLEFKHKM